MNWRLGGPGGLFVTAPLLRGNREWYTMHRPPARLAPWAALAFESFTLRAGRQESARCAGFRQNTHDFAIELFAFRRIVSRRGRTSFLPGRR